MKRLFLLLGLAAVIAVAAAGSALAGPNGNKLQCFSGTTDGSTYGGTCTLTNTDVATLNNNESNPNGDYSGVYLQNSNLDGKKLNSVNQLAFDYTGTATNGSPRISLPLDTMVLLGSSKSLKTGNRRWPLLGRRPPPMRST